MKGANFVLEIEETSMNEIARVLAGSLTLLCDELSQMKVKSMKVLVGDYR